MSDKIENKPAVKQEDQHALSNFAFDLLKGAALGAGAGALLAANRNAAEVAAAALVGGAGAVVADAAVKVGVPGIAGGAAGVIGGGVKDAAVKGAVGGVIGGAGVIVGNEIIKENKKEIQAVGQAVQNEAQRQWQELLDTPKDVMNHIQKRPVTSAVEALICPPLVIIDAKLRKLFGN